eukprot:191448-Rhodomonas_salina.2
MQRAAKQGGGAGTVREEEARRLRRESGVNIVTCSVACQHAPSTEHTTRSKANGKRTAQHSTAQHTKRTKSNTATHSTALQTDLAVDIGALVSPDHGQRVRPLLLLCLLLRLHAPTGILHVRAGHGVERKIGTRSTIRQVSTGHGVESHRQTGTG